MYGRVFSVWLQLIFFYGKVREVRYRLHIVSIIFLVVLGASIASKTRAAEIRTDTGQIVITGEIREGDFKKFQRAHREIGIKQRHIDVEFGVPKSTNPRKDIVKLRSNGGELSEAIRIGELIKRNNLKTYAYKGNCLSACALIWLAGSVRYIHSKARVGFHNVYDPANRRPQGNAVVGVYAAVMGFGYDTAAFITEAPAASFRYLPKGKSRHAGINYYVRDMEDDPVTWGTNNTPTQNPLRNSHQLPDGGVYVGKLKEGLPYGKGTMKFPDGEWYEGYWVNGVRNGIGTHKYSDGAEYHGGWENGKRSGRGKLVRTSGKTYEGLWRDGEPHGFGGEIFVGGTKLSGTWEKGKKHGIFEFWSGQHQGVMRTDFWFEGRRQDIDVFRDEKPWHVEFAKLDDRQSANRNYLRIWNAIKPVAGYSKLKLEEVNPADGVDTVFKIYLPTFTQEHAEFLCREAKQIDLPCEVLAVR